MNIKCKKSIEQYSKSTLLEGLTKEVDAENGDGNDRERDDCAAGTGVRCKRLLDERGDLNSPGLFEHEDGGCSLYPGLKCHEHHAVFNHAIMAVGNFAVSPGNFVLSSDGKRVLIRERELPKWGWATEEYIAAFERASSSGK